MGKNSDNTRCFNNALKFKGKGEVFSTKSKEDQWDILLEGRISKNSKNSSKEREYDSFISKYKPLDINSLNFQNLLDPNIVKYFKNFFIQFNSYPNISQIFRGKFIQWIEKNDLSIQKFNSYFFDPEEDSNPCMQPLIISKKFINYCKSIFLNVKEVIRGNYIGTYYIFDSFNLRDFNNINNTNFNLISLAEILGNYIGNDKIFFKQIIKADRTRKHRSIIIDKIFLDKLKPKLDFIKIKEY